MLELREMIIHHIKYQEANNRLLSVESFLLHKDLTLDTLKYYPKDYEYLKMACDYHLKEKALSGAYTHQVAVTLLEISSIEERLNELETNNS